jgi:hypothetical protein
MFGRHWIPLVAITAFALAGCPPPEEPPPDVPPAVEEPPPAAMISQEIEVTNEMEEALTVTARIDERVEELGRVEPGMVETFTVTGPEGTRAEIEARDAEGNVVESETITIEHERRDWRIERRNNDATY